MWQYKELERSVTSYSYQEKFVDMGGKLMPVNYDIQNQGEVMKFL